MPEFWEAAFQDKDAMWGPDPANSALTTAVLFEELGLQNVLIPGFGYGRNARPFLEAGMSVTGIEISATAITLAREQLGQEVRIHHGSVGGMPFDDEVYDGVFCYALIHLLDTPARARLIADCYRQLQPGGYLVFVALSTEDGAFGRGEEIGRNRFRTPHGVTLFFYDEEDVITEFGAYDLIDAEVIDEPVQGQRDAPPRRFWTIICQAA